MKRASTAEFGSDFNIAAPLMHHARSRADHPAIVQGERELRYRELDLRVRSTASYLMDLGLAKGDVVGVALRDSIEHLVAIFSLARAGIVMLPLDWRWTAGEQARVAAHFGAKSVLVEPDGARPDGAPCIVADEAWHSVAAAADPERPFPTGDGPLLMSLSSGTTGRPKGPLLNHAHFQRRFMVYWINLGVTSQDRYVSATPLYFGASRTFAMVMLYTGGTVCMFPPPYQPADLCEEIARRRATAVFLVPTMLRRLLALPDAKLAPFRSVKRLVSIGASLYPGEQKEIRRRIAAGFIDYYGSTEGGGFTCLMGEDAERFPESVGRPVFAMDVQCVDERDQPQPAGQVGRIRVRGPGIADRFWNDPDGSREAFRDGWYYPGDLGLMDAHGYLHLKGRSKEMIIRGGVNIYPAEVEAVLQSHPAVADSAAVGWPSREFNEEVAAFVILKDVATPAELRDYCGAQLAPYKVPREVFIVRDFPRNTLGKVIKGELAATLPSLG